MYNVKTDTFNKRWETMKTQLLICEIGNYILIGHNPFFFTWKLNFRFDMFDKIKKSVNQLIKSPKVLCQVNSWTNQRIF